MAYIGVVKPFSDPFKNRLELMNEFSVLLISVILPAFTELNQMGGVAKSSMGWFVLSVIIAQCLINFGIQAFFIVKRLIKLIRAKLRLRRRKLKAKIYDINHSFKINIVHHSNGDLTSAITPTNTMLHSSRTSKPSTPLLLTPNYLLGTHKSSPFDQSSQKTACSSNESAIFLVRNPSILFRGASGKNGIFKSTNKLLCSATVLETISENNLDDEQQQQPQESSRIEETK